MPVADARSTLSLTARVALPSRVYCNVSATPRSTIADRIVTIRSRRRDHDRPDLLADLVGVVRGNGLSRPPKRNRNRFLSMIDRPIVITICEIRPTSRLRSLAKPNRSSA